MGNPMQGAGDARELEALRRSVEEVNQRLARLEAMLEGIAGVVETTPALIATATDTVDQMVRSAQDHGVDLEARLTQGLRLLEKVSDPGVMRTLERLVSHSDKLDLVIEQLDALPGAVATAVNVFDDAMRYATAQGVDFDRLVRVLTGATTHLVTFAQSREFESLLGSGLLEPRALGVVEKAAVALKETQEEPPGQTGAFGMMRALGDADLQRALHFGVRFGRRFGQLLGDLSRRSLTP
jgi:uncharacterized protein YjgD (DUF1641 family)